MIPNTSFEGKKLFIDGKLLKEFENPIRKLCNYFDRIVILFDCDSFKNWNENVICIDLKDNLIWQVPKRNYDYTDSPFIDVSLIDPKLVKLWNWDGSYFVIKPETGEIVIDKKESVKNTRPW